MTRDVVTFYESLAKVAIAIETNGDNTESYFGWLPPVLQDFEWPQVDGRALNFIACIDLSQLPKVLDWLPATGKLLFFYDLEKTPSGRSPADKQGWAVYHILESPQSNDDVLKEYPDSLNLEHQFDFWSMSFTVEGSLPASRGQEMHALKLTDSEQDAVSDRWEGGSLNKIGGYSDEFYTADFQTDCELVAGGLDLSVPYSYDDKKAKEVSDRADRWKLLLQLSSDESRGEICTKHGFLFFWVPCEESRVGNFSNVWVTLEEGY